MRFDEIKKKLLNGFHDSYIKNINIDYLTREIKIKLDLCIGDPDAEDEKLREGFREGELTIKDFLYFVIDPPYFKYKYQNAGKLWLEDLDEIRDSSELPSNIPTNITNSAFVCRGFISNWNSFIYFAAMDAELKWLE